MVNLWQAEDFQQQVGVRICEKQCECWMRVGAAVYKKLYSRVGGPKMGHVRLHWLSQLKVLCESLNY